jgi:AcrR family transcriptional regulator
VTATRTQGERGQRERIIDAALQLMSVRGASATSMRQLASACGINVATLYHYFPSKADLLRSVIEERQYDVLLREAPVPAEGQAPRARLVQLLLMMWEGSLEEEPVWRLLLSESFRGDETALAIGADLLATIAGALEGWLGELFPELEVDRALAARAVAGQLYALIVETLFVPVAERGDHVRRRADDLAALLLPG